MLPMLLSLFSVSKAEIENQAKSAEKTYNEFLMETRCALLFEKSMSKEFAHSVEVEKGHLKVKFQVMFYSLWFTILAFLSVFYC